MKNHLIEELSKALSQIRQLQGLLPICSYCKKIRDDEGYWHQVDQYICEHSDTQFTHSICPDCYTVLKEELKKKEQLLSLYDRYAPKY